MYILLVKAIIFIWHFTCMLRGWGCGPVELPELGPWCKGAWRGAHQDWKPQSSCKLQPHSPCTTDPAVQLEQGSAPCATPATATRVLLQRQGGEHMSVCKRLLDSLSRMWNAEWAVVTPATHQQIEFQARSRRANNRFYFFFNISMNVSLNIHGLPWHYLSKANTHWRWAFYLYCKHPLVCMSTFNEPSENPQHSKTAFLHKLRGHIILSLIPTPSVDTLKLRNASEMRKHSSLLFSSKNLIVLTWPIRKSGASNSVRSLLESVGMGLLVEQSTRQCEQRWQSYAINHLYKCLLGGIWSLSTMLMVVVWSWW